MKVFEMMEALKRMPAGQNVCIVGLTGFDEPLEIQSITVGEEFEQNAYITVDDSNVLYADEEEVSKAA